MMSIGGWLGVFLGIFSLLSGCWIQELVVFFWVADIVLLGMSLLLE